MPSTLRSSYSRVRCSPILPTLSRTRASARESCRQAMNLDTDLAQAHICAATIAVGTGEHEQAIALLERALEIDPTADDAYRLMARAQESLGRHDAAVDTYSRAISLRP